MIVACSPSGSSPRTLRIKNIPFSGSGASGTRKSYTVPDPAFSMSFQHKIRFSHDGFSIPRATGTDNP